MRANKSRNVTNLVFAQKWKVEQDFQWLGVGSHDDQVGDTTVKSLGSFVSTLLQLLVVGGLLNKVKDGDGQLGVSKRVCLWVYFTHFGIRKIRCKLQVRTGNSKKSLTREITGDYESAGNE